MGVFEVFLHRLRSMETLIILVQDPLVLQFHVFPTSMPSEDLQDFNVIFLVNGCLWQRKVLIKMACVVKEHN